mmetsp:Transcript_23150/g.53703  ORF Transcript_23150/g.53703 Transcript_23150/m.53703 type:complete len:95 (+) Transcript_23150:295-579(+)
MKKKKKTEEAMMGKKSSDIAITSSSHDRFSTRNTNSLEDELAGPSFHNDESPPLDPDNEAVAPSEVRVLDVASALAQRQETALEVTLMRRNSNY